MRVTGRTLRRTAAGEEIAAFIPYPLPPRDPPLKLDGKLAALLLRAQQALARLDAIGRKHRLRNREHNRDDYRFPHIVSRARRTGFCPLE